MRHLVMAGRAGLDTDPRTVAELGPGDSMGIGLSALISGADHYYALDAKPHVVAALNRSVCEELIGFFERRMPIPDALEFPLTAPRLDSYEFPSDILTEARLARTLAPRRLDLIRRAVAGQSVTNREITIAYMAPWDDDAVIRPGEVDMVLSQAVLEHVEHVPETYKALRRWISPRGFMSHSIDFKSHGVAREWNGHWTIPAALWRVVRGNRPYLLNRLPLSRHVAAIKDARFAVVRSFVREMDPLPRVELAPDFTYLTDTDLSASGVFVQATPVG
jgi:hypothetical protein